MHYSIKSYKASVEYAQGLKKSKPIDPEGWERVDPVLLDGYKLSNKNVDDIIEDITNVGNFSKDSIIKGLDSIAFYKSYRYIDSQPFKGEWGIFIKVDGLLFLAEKFREFYFQKNGDDLDKSQSVQAVYHAIMMHEFMHHAMDFFISQIEFMSGCRIYDSITQQVSNGFISPEEGVCNRFALLCTRLDDNRLKLSGRESLDGFLRFVFDNQIGHYSAYDDSRCFIDYLIMITPGFGEGNVVDFIEAGVADHPVTNIVWGDYFLNLYGDHSVPVHFIEVANASHQPSKINVVIKKIEESQKFLKKLERKGGNYKKCWDGVKQKIKKFMSTYGGGVINLADVKGLNVKFMDKRGPRWVLSIRCNNNVRAHLEYRREDHTAVAIKIGAHKEMGHG